VTYEDEIESWRTSRMAALAGPQGWLTAVGLFWLHEGPNILGSDPSADVALPPVAGRRFIGSIDVSKEQATARLEPGAGVEFEGREVTTLQLRDDLDGHPTVLALGSLRLHLIRRAGSLAVRVRDEDSPARRSLGKIPHFPVHPRWRVGASWEPYRPERLIVLPTVVGPGQEYRILGRLAFQLQGESLTLEAYQELDETDLFIVFGDLTNHRETYGGGRYLYASPPGADGSAVLDFNQAYNPPCVFTPYATCVLTQPDNRLEVRIEAGERRYEASFGGVCCSTAPTGGTGRPRLA
jgi:uncharacterized protein